jgi:hypothetical protein
MKSKLNKSITSLPIPDQMIRRRIYFIRGQKVMLDSDLAELYQTPTKFLNLAARRNKEKFPEDFMFQLTNPEIENLRLQIATSSLKANYGGRRYLPYAFTEHGIAMLSSVLKSKRAVQMNILIIRTFIQIRKLLAANSSLSQRLDKIEGILKLHDEVINIMIRDIKKSENPPRINAIGFRTK